MSNRVTLAKLAPAPVLCLLTVALLLVVGLLHLGTSYGDQLPNRSIMFSKAIPGASDEFTVQFQLPAAEVLGSIQMEFCSEGPLIGTPCTPPAGFKLSTGTLSNQTGETGFSVNAASTDNVLLLSRPPQLSTATNLTYTMSGVIDPGATGTYFTRLQTFASNNGTGSSTDYGGLAFAISNLVSVSATVPPYLYFCLGISITNTDCTTATGDYINFGDFTPIAASTAETQMVAGTNGDTGYGITVNGTTLTSGINIIPAIPAQDVSRPGTSQFGLNLVANSDPTVGENPSGSGSGTPTVAYNVPDRYQFVSGDIVASTPAPDLPRKYTTSYVTNIVKSQAAGIYVSTLTYIATAGF